MYRKMSALHRVMIALIVFTGFAHSCTAADQKVVTGAERASEYLPLLRDRMVAVVANQTSLVGDRHLIDTLLALGVEVTTIFAPEHGFREMASAGATVTDGVDELTGVRIVSLYGNRNYKPRPSDMADIDIVIFDIQDVGARFYTYISTMHYVMEACAENGKSCLVFDRPNPNGHFVDGPLLEPAFRSFVGMHPVPVVHGMTTGEYALMINGEGWLAGGVQCDLTIIGCVNYTHSTEYVLPVRPSPNLPNQTSVCLYPSLCFFEGTNISVGRGTPWPFQVAGAPELEGMCDFSFTPRELAGAASPLHRDRLCFGIDLRDASEKGLVPMSTLDLSWLIELWNLYPDKENFFKSYFDTLAGTASLRKQIEAGMKAGEIRASWQADLQRYKAMREKYLLYPE